MATYPWAPPDAPISAVNVRPSGATMDEFVNGSQFVHVGGDVHSLTGSLVRLSG